MQNVNKNIAAGSIGGSGALIAMFTWLFEPNEITNFISSYPKLIIGIVCLLIISVIVLVTLIINSRDVKATKQKNLQQTLYEEGRTWTHTVLIVDDKETDRLAIKDELQGFDVVDIERIDDYRLAAQFEIIVSDIFDCSPGTTASAVLNTIKQKYPYKFVIPMSAQPGACEKLDADTDIIYKDDNKKFVTQVRDKVISLSEKLDDVVQHWSDVNNSLISKNKSEKQIEIIKYNYYRFVNMIQNGF